MGYERVDKNAVSDAIAGQTLFIHGNSISGRIINPVEGTATISAGTSHVTLVPLDQNDEPLCESPCGIDVVGLPQGTSTVCDPSCSSYEDRFGGFLCGAGDAIKYGAMCRLCYTDIATAMEAERQIMASHGDSESEPTHVIMCDTMRPPEAPGCSDECNIKKDTVSLSDIT